MSYRQARKDFEFLEGIAELSDQIVLDSERLDLMREPTKARAARMYIGGIQLWLNEHGDCDDARVKRIAKRWQS